MQYWTPDLKRRSLIKPKILFAMMLILGSGLMLLPFWVMVITSLTPSAEVFTNRHHTWVWPPDWSNYTRLFTSIPMARYALNSALVSVITTVVHVFLCAMAGYGFAKFEFKGKTLLFTLCLLTLLIPPQVNIVPLFFMMNQFDWMNTYWALIVPGLFGAFGIILLRQWFSTLPNELLDAAHLDGCNAWQTFIKVALPLATPALAALAIFVFIGSWNSFMWPLIVTHSPELRTLPVGLAELKGSYRDVMDWSVLMAAATVSVIPVCVVFLLGQRQFLTGLTEGGVKE